VRFTESADKCHTQRRFLEPSERSKGASH